LSVDNVSKDVSEKKYIHKKMAGNELNTATADVTGKLVNCTKQTDT